MTTEQKTTFIRIGDFFFKFRNQLFPAVLALVFFTYAPPYSYDGNHQLEENKDVLAMLIVALGLMIRGAVIGYAYIKRGGLNKQVYAESLVTEGFFAVSRNPLYVGNMLIYIGVFLMHGNPYVVSVGILAMYGIYSSIIAAEEYFLRTHFGEGYARYCQDVPRWLPRLPHFKSNLRSATEGMQFSFARVLVKDYTTITYSLFALCMVEIIEGWHMNGEIKQLPLSIIACLAVFLICVRVAKKRKWIVAA